MHRAARADRPRVSQGPSTSPQLHVTASRPQYLHISTPLPPYCFKSPRTLYSPSENIFGTNGPLPLPPPLPFPFPPALRSNIAAPAVRPRCLLSTQAAPGLLGIPLLRECTPRGRPGAPTARDLISALGHILPCLPPRPLSSTPFSRPPPSHPLSCHPHPPFRLPIPPTSRHPPVLQRAPRMGQRRHPRPLGGCRNNHLHRRELHDRG